MRGNINHAPCVLPPSIVSRAHWAGCLEIYMRTLFGIILGVALTIGGAYLYDSSHALNAANTTASVEKPMVNWDIVNTKWQHLTERARSEWNRVTG
jgi:hypothetical protein